MKTMLERIEREAAKVGLKTNVNKSKEMRIVMNNNETLRIHSENIERVTQFAYVMNEGFTHFVLCILCPHVKIFMLGLFNIASNLVDLQRSDC
jgi:hypothetical protein